MSVGGRRSALEMSDGFVAQGSVVGGYRIERRLTTGGMAELFLARTPAGALQLERPVVLKALPPVLVDDYQWRSMFFNEARLAARLDHVNLVRVFDLLVEDDRPYIVMEYLDGHNLREVVRRGRLSYGLACHVVAEVLAGLAYVHDRKDACGRPLGLVHRDVSPTNIMLTFAGHIKLIDFGIAKASEAIRSDLTAAGQFKGKCSYSAPEQVRCRDVDRRSDLFAAGIVLWELLAGRRLFARASELESMRAILQDPIPPVRALAPEVPEALERVVARALERDPDQRYQRAEEMRDELERAVQAAGWPAGSLQVERLMRVRFAAAGDGDAGEAGAAMGEAATTVDPMCGEPFVARGDDALDSDELDIVVTPPIDERTELVAEGFGGGALAADEVAAGALAPDELDGLDELDDDDLVPDDEEPAATAIVAGETMLTELTPPVLVAAELVARPDEPTRSSRELSLKRAVDWKLVLAAALAALAACGVTVAAQHLVDAARAAPPPHAAHR